ncbi:MAG TPA: hypothetical protein VE567_08780 [Sphingomonas sp.]|nr:hypothetical protein [Sphingomonas sp.]
MRLADPPHAKLGLRGPALEIDCQFDQRDLGQRIVEIARKATALGSLIEEFRHAFCHYRKTILT